MINRFLLRFAKDAQRGTFIKEMDTPLDKSIHGWYSILEKPPGKRENLQRSFRLPNETMMVIGEVLRLIGLSNNSVSRLDGVEF
ncbi:hypothetical protein Lal_00038165 [Lupinus albus]|nr:hypothetical protein Lal_00038165 [Lupinus albus]